jgi:signal transduction histidine kinase
VALGALGLALLVAAPAATRLVLFIEAPLARGLLGPSTRQRLQHSRARAMEGSAAELRRIERDLHDGPQAQLVAIALKLGLAKEELAAGDSKAAMDLVDTAHEGAKAALTELRDLVRGIHPPILADGLGPALETLAARSGLVVEVVVEFRQRVSPAIETVAYFCAAELITNVAKHSGVTRASLRLTSLPRDRFRLAVSDDGIGGAQSGGGLSGLAARVDAVDGALMIHSPPGGPTLVQVDLPMQA